MKRSTEEQTQQEYETLLKCFMELYEGHLKGLVGPVGLRKVETILLFTETPEQRTDRKKVMELTYDTTTRRSKNNLNALENFEASAKGEY